MVSLFAIVFSAIIKLNPFYLALIPAWIVADLSLTSIFFNSFATYKSTDFLHQMVVQLLILDNELGYVFKCLEKRKPSYIFKDVVYFDGQLDGLLDNGAIAVWCNLASLILLFTCLFLL